MKIVCLIRPGAPLHYFVNSINFHLPVKEVIVEVPKSYRHKNLINRLSKLNVKYVIKRIKKHFFRESSEEKIYNKWFSNNWKNLNENIPITIVDNINSDIVYQKIKSIQPDLLLDHGTSILKERIFNLSKIALNIHWGLSPYYRGTHCTEWALINWDPYNIGVTIHKLSKDIDGGSILAQKRVKINSFDTVLSINMQLTFLAVEQIIEIINKIQNKEKLIFKKQDFSKGFLTYHRQWSQHLENQIDFIEKNQIISQMLINPSRKRLL